MHGLFATIMCLWKIGAYTERVLPDNVSILLMPPFRGSRSGDRDWRAMEASRDEGKGTSIALKIG